MQFKKDKRSLKTRKAIKIAFLKLVKIKEISQINITEIAHNAGINRNSFYTHYKSVNNILDDINDEIFLYMEGILSKYTYGQIVIDPFPIIFEFSNVVMENTFISQYLIFSKSSNELVRKLKNSVCDRFYELYERDNQTPNPYMRYVIGFIISGVFETYYIWYKNNKNLSLEEVSKKISTLILKGIKQL